MNKVSYRPDVDGLRAIAVLSVFLYHLDISLFSGGFVGVDVFFVISGFVITSQIIRLYKQNKFSFKDFYYRRIKRILPAVYFLIFVCSLFAIFTLYPSDYRKFFSAAKKVILLIPNFYFSRNTNYFEPAHDTSPLLHTWSLGVEEQLYMIFPVILIWLLHQSKLKYTLYKTTAVTVALLISSFILCLYLTKYYPSQAFYMVYSRAWEFLIGSIIAFNILPKIQNPFQASFLAATGIVTLAYPIFFLDSTSLFPGINALLPCLGTALLIYSGLYINPISKILSTKPFNFTGKISYSLYLWHWPIIIFYKQLSGKEISKEISFIILVSAYVLAYLSWRYIETPFRKHDSISKFTIYLYNKLKSLSFIKIFKNSNLIDFNKSFIILSSISILIIYPLLLTILGSAYKADWRVYKVESGINKTKDMIFQSNNQNFQVLLLGDSHAAHYYRAVQRWSNQNKMNAKVFAYSACPGVLTDYKTNDRDYVVKACREHIQKANKIIDNNPQIKYVFLASRQDKYTETKSDLDNFTIALRQTVEKLKNKNIQVVVLDQVPLFKNPPFYTTIWDKNFDQSRRHQSFANIDYDYINYKLTPSRQALQQIVNDYSISYFDPLIYIKSGYYNNNSMYFDENHLNKYGSEYLAEIFTLPTST